MNSFTVWEGSQISLAATQGDENSISASIFMVNQETQDTIDYTAVFEEVDGVMTADLGFSAPEPGVYDYYITENFNDEEPYIYPDHDCDGEECTLPTITVCELPGGTS